MSGVKDEQSDVYFKKRGLTNIGIKSPTPIKKKKKKAITIEAWQKVSRQKHWFGKSSECPELHFWILQFYSSECSV